MLKTVRDVSGITYESLKRELESGSVPKKVNEQAVPEFNDNAGDKVSVAARFILASYLFNKPFAQETDIENLEFTDGAHKAIKDFIVQKRNENQKIKFNELYEVFGEEMNEEISRIAGMETEENKAFDQGAYFFDCVKTIKTDKISKEIDRLSTLFAAETDMAKRKEFTKEMAKLLAEKNKLK